MTKKTAIISSTSIDLPEHRREAKEACLRASVFPDGMETWPAQDLDAVAASLRKVDEADVYIGIYAWRYGHVPDGHDVSITELEFERAVKRGIPILVFLMDRKHPVEIDMIEMDPVAQAKLQALKERAAKGRTRREFESPVDLRGHIIQALAELEKLEREGEAGPRAPSLHRPSHIPTAPDRYVAHPYTLLQTADVVGRRDELRELTAWITDPRGARVFSVVAIGGMGKSALTWKWFEDVGPNERPDLAGRMWWSFYELDAHFENFVIRALAYTSGRSEDDARTLSPPDRASELLRRLDERPFLIVLDGLERILLAYSRLDAAHMLDDDLDQETANAIADAYGLPDDIKETYLEKHRLRGCADPRVGKFLRQLTRVRASRILLSTRLYPAELQTQTAQLLAGTAAMFLRGLTDDDALALWRGFIGGARSGTSDQLLPVFRAFENYPLLLRALAGEIAEYKRAPGDFVQWRHDHPAFDPSVLPLKNAKTHVLEFALRGLDDARRGVLHTIAAFRMPASWDTLRSLLVAPTAPDAAAAEAPGRLPNERALDAVLTELEDRGLVGWDRAANRYDLHPIVRSVVWATLGSAAKDDIYDRMHVYFDAAPRPPDWTAVERIEDLASVVELYSALVGKRRFDEAALLYHTHLMTAMHFRLSVSRLRIELVEHLYPDGIDEPPRLTYGGYQAWALSQLGMSYTEAGEPGRAVVLMRRAVAIRRQMANQHGFIDIDLSNLSEEARSSGRLCEALAAGREALVNVPSAEGGFHQAVILTTLGACMAALGDALHAEVAFARSLKIGIAENYPSAQTVALRSLAIHLLQAGRLTEAERLANAAEGTARAARQERDSSITAGFQGAVALAVGDLAGAEERLQYAIERARADNLVVAELPALVSFAELRRRQGRHDEAREFLDDLWPLAERGPYVLVHADALNVLAQIERDEGHHATAVDAATRAFTLAWCDGPPYAYHYALTNARAHLEALGAPEPGLPPFDASKHEPLPDVDINPRDEYHVAPDTD